MTMHLGSAEEGNLGSFFPKEHHDRANKGTCVCVCAGVL